MCEKVPHPTAVIITCHLKKKQKKTTGKQSTHVAIIFVQNAPVSSIFLGFAYPWLGLFALLTDVGAPLVFSRSIFPVTAAYDIIYIN